MGTNYYLPQTCPNACSHCTLEDLHIGKRSMGWTFGFRGYPDVRSRKDWEARVSEVGAVCDEYGAEYTPAEFWALVDATRHPQTPRPDGQPPLTRHGSRGKYNIPLDCPNDWVDPEGWDFTDVEFS